MKEYIMKICSFIVRFIKNGFRLRAVFFSKSSSKICFSPPLALKETLVNKVQFDKPLRQ